MSDNIKVVVKVRPLISRELEDKLQHQWRVQNNTLHQLDQNGRDSGQAFTFDKVYDEDTKTSEVYNEVAKPIVQAATAGFNGTIFAYGQTSSGKTYTMTGTEDSPGIIPLSVINLFEIIKNVPNRDFLVRVSYIEIYNETVKDLLDMKKENIKIHEDYNGCIKVDATENVTSSPEDVLEAMRKGEANRQTGSTNMNEKSSRSHSIFQITIESREHTFGTEEAGCVNVSQLNLVDLAGSERAGQTGATGIRFKEGTHINRSLSALALVIKQLSEDPNKYANYRDSKLTRILQNSLGGNAKTSIICAITPAALEETISTLQFATRAKAIKNKPEVNAVATDATMIQSLTKQLAQLQSQLESKKNLEVILENKKHVEQDLQKQIAALQKLILNGFGQRSSIEQIGGARRKQPPRRMTISTLHSIDEDQVSAVPKFCTPSLKYNPMLVQYPSEFAPIQNPSKLSTLPEEPARVITPPPDEKRNNLSGDVIEIDSDDDDDVNKTGSTVSTCSPYHKCYTASKTPPCILRKNFHRAEKNYKEIVEFTEREKLYKPEVVELMEKLEESTNKAAQLQEEIELLRKNSKERDLEREHLVIKIKKSEEDVRNAKMELESYTDDYKTKLTDWEVSYEILKKKAKLREDELLSLLEEQKLKKCEDISKLPPKPVEKEPINFMDMSKDISLVNSDNESSVIASNEDESEQMKALVASMQDQLIAKCQTIVQLEANIASQKQSIEYLEQSTHDLEKLINSVKEKNVLLENENKLYKSNMDALNNTIQSQKENQKIAQNDIAMYNNTIQELQDQLKIKNDLLNMRLSDSVLENMIINEDKVIANNENIKNIIHSFKIELGNRNKEIEQLNISIKENNESIKHSLLNDMNDKMKQIETLTEEISALKNEANNKITTIDSLMRDKSHFADVEKELVKKIDELETQKLELCDLNKEHILRIENLNETNNSIMQSMSENNEKEKEYVELISKLQNKLDEMSHKIIQMEEEINAKNEMISSLSNLNNDKQEYEDHAKSALDKLKSVMSILSGDVQEIPNFIENCVTMFNALSSGLNVLENVATDTISEKSNVLKENSQLKLEIIELRDKFDEEQLKLKNEINQLQQGIKNYLTEIEKLKETNKRMCDEQNSEYQLQLKEEMLRNALAVNEELNRELKDKHEEVTMLQDKCIYQAQFKDQQMKDICNKLCDVVNKLNIEDSYSCEGECDSNSYDLVLLLLDKITSENLSRKNILQEHSDAKKYVETLLHDNQKLKNAFSKLENENNVLSLEMTVNNSELESLCQHLTASNDLLERVKEDLKNKMDLIDIMNNKAKECKQQFDDLDIAMYQTVQDLRLENETLKACYQKSFENQMKTCSSSIETHELAPSFGKPVRLSGCDTNKQSHLAIITPPSLLTICCNKIVDAMEPKQNEPNLTTPSSSDTEMQSVAKTLNCPNCETMDLELHMLQQEKRTLLGIVEQIERENKELIVEQENIRQEVRLLLEPAQELQKKISRHKTNMSILTATTYAENRSLKSQVMALKYQNRKLLNVCQGDIPEFKKQLRDLFVMLKSDCNSENQNLKRYSLPDVLDNNSTACNFKNDESALDGDILMLDTNVTMTTTGDNTLVGSDQTCLDVTQTLFNETSNQFSDPNRTEPNINSQISLLESDSQHMFASLEVLKEENCKLKALLNKLSFVKGTQNKVDTQSSPIREVTFNDKLLCTKCQVDTNISTHAGHTDIEEEVKCLKQKLEDIQTEKQTIEKKYNNLVLELPNTDVLVSKLIALEKDINLKTSDITKLTNTLNINNKDLKRLTDENDILSTQVMESISEVDDLNKELNKLKSENIQLAERVLHLESIKQANAFKCPHCKSSLIEATCSVPNTDKPHAKLNRSLSDSETSSRFNKICTLQSELCAGREDCKVLTEHVATIKQHFNCSNMSMDLDESMGDSNISLPRNVAQNSLHTVCNMPNIQEEQPLDIYTVDRLDCYNYYLEITGEEREDVSNNVKIIDILKMFYNSLLEKHGNEIENLVNKLKQYEESKNILLTQTDDLVAKYAALKNAFDDKDENLSSVSKFMSQLKNNIKRMNHEINSLKADDDLGKIINMFKNNFLKSLDYEFGMSSTNVFEALTRKCQVKEQNATPEYDTSNVVKEMGITSNNIQELEGKLAAKEKEYDLLKAQKEKMFQISSAVTLDVVRKEQKIHKSLIEGCQKLLEHKIIASDLALSGSPIDNISIFIDHIINQSQSKSVNFQQLQTENEMLSLEINMSKNILDDKEKELNELKIQNQSLRDINNNVTLDLADKEEKIQTLKTAHDDLNNAYNLKIQENINKLNEINKLTEELSNLRETINKHEWLISSLTEKDTKITDLLHTIEELQQNNEKLNEEICNQKETINKKEWLISSLTEKDTKITELLDSIDVLQQDKEKLNEEICSLKDTIGKKESLISSLSEKNAKTTELLQTIKELQEDNDRLISINQMMSKESESYSTDLKKSSETIRQNNAEIDRMTSDILILRESVKDATSIIESLKQDVQKLTAVNSELTLSLEEKRRECVRLEMNIKTHDKTAELQSKIIIRLNKQKEEDDRVINEKQTTINEINEKYNMLQNEWQKLKDAKESLEQCVRVSELSEQAERARVSLEPADTSRRRRQSLHDSKRVLAHLEEHRDLENVFASRQKADDLFAEDDSSGRSTPFGLGRGRDSLLSRTDQSDKDEEHGSRPSSVQAARRRRQSIHDLHRGVQRHTPSPHDLSGRINDDNSANKSDSDEANSVCAQLAACRQELAELREQYRELDEECETCAEYLRERDQQCARMKKEKAALEKQILELKSHNISSQKPSVAHVAVNTDEDWANLHSVVVDRMSYDAEVEKNKKLTKVMEELRFQKQDLRNTVAKMQKALEKQQSSRDNKELESARKELKVVKEELKVVREELKVVKEELEELKVKYKELDEECETCAEYLKEREEQCRRLKEAKAALEVKLQELQEDSHALAHYSVRRKRQTMHDMNRNSGVEQTDASTDTSEDLLSHQVDRDKSETGHDDKQREIKRLKMMVEKLSHQKAAMEQQLKSGHPPPAPMYVATGSAIVQNQQLTDVMKENQRLKKMNAKLVNICKKRGKSDANRENEDPCDQG